MLQKIGKYQIVDRVGAGAMGEVYKAFDPMLKRWVALKVFSSHLEVTDELRARFFQEAQAGAMLSHPNIVTVHDLGEQDGYLFIVMELLEGQELRQLMATRKDIGLEEKLSIMVQVCKGVEYAHRKGIVHRDIKPANIFVLTNGHVKLLDFGVARLATMDTGLTRGGLIMGTLRYMSPEQCRGRADYRSDIFSVGAVFYELLAYRPAFIGDDTLALLDQVQHAEPPSLMALDPILPEPVSSAVHRALQKDPSARFADISEMRIELERTQQSLVDEADRARTRVQAGLREMQTLEHALAASFGAVVDAGPPVAAVETAPLTSLRKIEAELEDRVERLRSQLDRARSVEPSVEDASRLTRAGDYDAAILGLQQVLEQMPEHARASEALRYARDSRERMLATTIFHKATEAMSRRAYRDCIESLDALAGVENVPPDISARAHELRQVADAELSQHERDATQSDLTVLDTRLPGQTQRRLASSPSIGADHARFDRSDVETLGDRRQLADLIALGRLDETRRLFGRDTEPADVASDQVVPERRGRTRRIWVTGAAVGVLTGFVGAYWLGWMPASQWHISREQVNHVLSFAPKAWLPQWLAALGNTSPPQPIVEPVPQQLAPQKHIDRPASSGDFTTGAVQRQVESETPLVGRRAEPETPASTRHEASQPVPPVAEGARQTEPDRTPLELPPRSPSPNRDQAAKPPPTAPPPPLAVPFSTPRGSGEAPSTPSPLARSTPPSDPPAPAKRAPLPALSPGAPLTETAVWLAQALKEHAEPDRLSSGVMYHVRRIDSCSIEWSALKATGEGCVGKVALNQVDPNRTAVAQRDGGWIIDLPWIENDGVRDCEDPFTKLVVWFRERETATQIATAFKQAINLCSR